MHAKTAGKRGHRSVRSALKDKQPFSRVPLECPTNHEPPAQRQRTRPNPACRLVSGLLLRYNEGRGQKVRNPGKTLHLAQNDNYIILVRDMRNPFARKFPSSFCEDDGHCLHEIIYMPAFSSSPFPRAFPSFFLAGMYAQ